MNRLLFLAPVLLLLNANGSVYGQSVTERKAMAEHFFRGVYGCDPSVVDDLASDDIAVSYPIFQQIYDIPAFRGRDAVRKFAEGFCSRWSDAQFTFHESIAEDDVVVLLWSFSAKFVGSGSDGPPSTPPVGSVQSWGGISIYRFNEDGKITVEVGEESVPGPVDRLAASEPD